MDTEEYKKAVLEMYKAMQDVFQANETLRLAAERVWAWDSPRHDETHMSSIREVPSPLLPPSPRSEPEEEDAEPVPCGCAHDIWKPCAHVCSICEKSLTIKDSEGMCFECEKDLDRFPKEFPADAADAKMNSVYDEGAFHALIVRFRANGCRGSAMHTEDAEEVRQFLKEAERLDARASELLDHKSPHHYKPWWFARWSYPLPESSYKPVCGDCEKPKKDGLGHCKLCEKPLTCCTASKNDEFACLFCEEDLRTLPEDYPEDAAEAKAVCASAFHALVLRIQANNHREAADDTVDSKEHEDCLAEAERLDKVATGILKNNAPAFKPWWQIRWDYWRQPGSTHAVPTWAPKEAEHAAPAGCYTSCTLMHTPKGTSHIGLCRSSPTLTEEPPVSEWPARRAESENWVQLWAEAAAAGIPSPPRPAAKPTKPTYNHPLWPSPRPKLFAKALGFKIKKHEDALEYLAQRAKITVEELLKMDPDIYAEKHMGGKRNAPYNCNKQRGWPYMFYGY